MATQQPNPGARGPGGATPGGTSDQSQGTIGRVADKVQNTAGQVADQVQETVAPVVDQAQEKAGQVAEQARSQVTTRLDGQKERLVSGLGMVALAVRQTGQQMREQDVGPVAEYADKAAEQVEKVSQYLRRTEVDELIGQAERFARRQPTVFLGGGLALGLLAARFLKSSAQRAAASASKIGDGASARPAAPGPAASLLEPPYGSATAPTRPIPGGTGMPGRPATSAPTTMPGSVGTAGAVGTPGAPSRPTMPPPLSSGPGAGTAPRMPGSPDAPPTRDPKDR